MPSLPPRVVVAGTHSGVGKTTVATGVLAALAARGVRVGAAKVGPDFIDPGYHRLACGRPSRNLDVRLCGEEAVRAVAARAGAGCQLLLVEGVMGLFDGAGSGPEASTAHVARLLDAPVVLVVDAAGLSGSIAPLVHGFASFDPRIRLLGVVLNRVGSESHETLLREALIPVGIPVLGALRRDDRVVWRDRHLGLVPVAERPDEVREAVAALSAVVAAGVDLDAILALGRSAPAADAGEVPVPARWDQPGLSPTKVPVPAPSDRKNPASTETSAPAPGPTGRPTTETAEISAPAPAPSERPTPASDEAPPPPPSSQPPSAHGAPPIAPPPAGRRPPVVALAGGPAFSFTYPELPEALVAAGAEVIPFDPRHDPALPPDATALITGGGFPEVFAAELAANEPLLADLRRRVGCGLPTWAECGGLLWLARSLDGRPLAGLVPADGRMTDRLTLGYRTVTTRSPSPIGPAGTTIQGHEFRYSELDPPGDALDVRGRFGRRSAGYASPFLLASYLHVHPVGEPDAVAAFVRAAASERPGR